MTLQFQPLTQLCLRIFASLMGGYAFIWGFLSAGTTASVAAGIEYEEAYTGFTLLAFLVYLALFLWSFADRSLLRVVTILFGGGALMTAAAWALQNQLLQGV